MIFQALYELAQAEGLLENTSYESIGVSYLISLGAGGKYLGLRSTLFQPTDKHGKPRGSTRPVERKVPKRSGRKANAQEEFLVDKAEYVFGSDPSGKRAPEKLAIRHQLFKDAVAQALEALPDNPGLAAVRGFLDLEPPDEIKALLVPEAKADESRLSGALFAFLYEPDGGVQCVHDDPGVKAYWRARLDASEGAPLGQCLVTGKKDVPLVRLHGTPKGIPPVAKTKGGVPITSVNTASFRSYGLENIGCAPISREASLGIEIALTRLLHPAYAGPDGQKLEPRCVHISPDTAMLFWSRDPEAGLGFLLELEANPAEVEKLLSTPFRGRAPVVDPSLFYALFISGTQGRAVVRSFVSATVKEVAARVNSYLEEVRITKPWGEPDGAFPLRRVRHALVPEGKLEKLPPALGTALYLAILNGTPYPRAVLEAAVRRNRVDPLPLSSLTHKVDESILAARCSIIKACLIRNFQEEITVALNPNRQDSYYRLGRLLALLDKVQQEALGNVNATIVDRYYGSASSTPAAIFPTLLRRAQHHLAKMRKEKAGLAINRERLLQEILGAIDDYPQTMNLEQQGLFSLGFYHQRQAFYTPATSETDAHAKEEIQEEA